VRCQWPLPDRQSDERKARVLRASVGQTNTAGCLRRAFLGGGRQTSHSVLLRYDEFMTYFAVFVCLSGMFTASHGWTRPGRRDCLPEAAETISRSLMPAPLAFVQGVRVSRKDDGRAEARA
jgi:hypothetical protein